MNSAPPAAPGPAPNPEDNTRHLPESARAAYREYRATGEAAALDPLILAILQSYLPRKSGHHIVADLPGKTELVGGLGFDSLAIAEIVFFTEDLFGVNIANTEIAGLRTLDDLRAFIRHKVATRGNH